MIYHVINPAMTSVNTARCGFGKVMLMALIAAFFALPSNAYFIWPETMQVPTTRVLTDLQKHLAANTNDPQTLYYIGRIYSMLFAGNTYVLNVKTRTYSLDEYKGEPVFAPPGADTGLPPKVYPRDTPELRA